ncbi:hypothetical protein RR48_14102 [Papilio machaon]|uniref:BPTI/Kunitz inhibitor domain-containing protein n=1 Tax=Papilio machaon TaxID=76193 RepID=A0A194QLC4_PAPMA|nr:hypothetical protein RR48_14102 [Papilio machaon]
MAEDIFAQDERERESLRRMLYDTLCFVYLRLDQAAVPLRCNRPQDFAYGLTAKCKSERTCKRYLYSGCGGNQNNFQTRDECFKTCLIPPSNSLKEISTFTTCIPVNYIPAIFPIF